MNVSRLWFPLGVICLVSYSMVSAQSDTRELQGRSGQPPMDTRRPAPDSGAGTGMVTTAKAGDFSRELPGDHLCFNVNTLMADNWSDPLLVEKATRLNPDVLRIPGGTVANYWDWRRGGLVELKGMGDLPGQFRLGHVSAYDQGKVDAYRGLFEATGARAMIVLNMLTSDLDSQLEYIRHALDSGLPVRYVELGNELYESRPGHMDVYPTPESYAKTAASWARAVRESFPGVEVAVIGANPRVAARKSDRRVTTWNDSVIEMALPNADALTFHDYQQAMLRSGQFPPEEVERALAGALQQTREMVDDNLTRRMPAASEIWVTEFNIQPVRGSVPVAGTWMHGLYVAAMTAALMEEPSVTIMCNHVLLGDAAFAAIFADEKTMRAPVFAGQDRRSAVGVRPFTLSASGLTLALYSRAVQDKQKATLLEFPVPAAGSATDPRSSGQRMPAAGSATDPRNSGQRMPAGGTARYPARSGQRMPAAGYMRDYRGSGQRVAGDRGAVYGWLYEGPPGQWSAFVLNLSARNLTLQADFLTRFGYEQLSADPGLVVSRDDQLQPVTGEGEKSLSLLPYSITRIYSR